MTEVRRLFFYCLAKCKIHDLTNWSCWMSSLRIAGRAFRSRLMLGTGKYRSPEVMAACHRESGAEIITVAVRRINLSESQKDSVLSHLVGESYFLLPNTAGCKTAAEAVRTALLAREAGFSNWIKLEVIGDERTLFPDNQGLLEATQILVKEGFVVLPYTTDDLINARKLIDAGASAVMPLGAPIGSGLGIQNRVNLRILREQITDTPLIVDAGVGTASDVAIAMEMGYDAVLLNTAVATAKDSVKMAAAMSHAVTAGRLAFEAGRMGQYLYATASSPVDGLSSPASFRRTAELERIPDLTAKQ
jgi:thiazole synthase